MRKPKGYWTFELCKEEALKYESRSEFQKGSYSAYKNSRKNKWLDKICGHMGGRKKKDIYWTFDRCKEEALKYDSRSEFQKFSRTAYEYSRREKRFHEICGHMKIKGTLHKRFLYVIMNDVKTEFYVGITYNLEKRLSQHRVRMGNNINYYWHSKKAIDCQIVSKMEDRLIKYLSNLGICSLNKIKGGGLGGNKQLWTFERCKEEALKYDSRNSFRKGSNSAYQSARKNKWFCSICKHMKEIRKPKGYWTFERCKEEALKYESRGEFKKGSKSVYDTSWKNKWLDDFFPKEQQLNNDITKTPA